MAHTSNRSSSDRCRAQCRSEPAGHHPSGPGVPTQLHRCDGADLPLDDVQAGSAAPGVTLYTAAQAAAVFQRTTRTLRNWVRSGLLQPIRVGHSLYFSEIELLRVINGGQAPPVANPSPGAAEPTLPTGCDAVGTTDVNRLYNFLAGRSGSLSANTLLRIGAVLPHVSLTHLVVPDHIDPGIRMIGHDTVVVDPTSIASEPAMSETSRQAANPAPFAGIQRCVQRLEAELTLLKRLLTDMQAQYRGRSG